MRVAIIAVATLLVALGVWFTPSRAPLGPTETVSGVVISAGSIGSTRASGGSHSLAHVELHGGARVYANVAPGLHLKAGDTVVVLAYGPPGNASAHEVVRKQ